MPMLIQRPIVCTPKFEKVSRLIDLETAYRLYSSLIAQLDSYINKPGQIQRRPIGFGAYCDRLRARGWRVL